MEAYFNELDEKPDNENLLSDIAQTLSSNEQTGPPISDHLAKIKRNSSELYVPKVNLEIWQNMKPYAKKADIKVANLQDTLIKGLSGQNLSNLQMYPKLIDAAALVGHVYKELSYTQKEAIRPILHPGQFPPKKYPNQRQQSSQNRKQFHKN